MRLSLFAILVICCNVEVIFADDVVTPSRFTRAGHTTDTLKTVQQRLEEKKAVLIDVREKNEWDAGHLRDANLVPLSAIRADKLTEQMKKNLPKGKPIYCHCRSGGRVLTASKLLRAQGYDIRPLAAGFSTLVAEGFTKATEPKK